MQRSPLWTLMQRVQRALKSGNPETQDIAISNLQEFLDNACAEYFPTFVYPPLGRVLRYYCDNTLLQLTLDSADRQYVREVFTATIERLEAQKQRASEIEGQMRIFLTRLKALEFTGVEDVAASFCRIPGIEIPKVLRELVLAYRLLGKSPFTTASLTPFLETLLRTVVSEADAAQFTPLRYIFWDQAAEQTQMKAALVNPFSQEARITRLDVWTGLEPQESDQLTFDNEVDERLYASCWQALEVARQFLESRFPGLLERKGIRVVCRFPDSIASYSDASVSALVGLKVVGDLLNLPVHPAAIISADVERSGKIRTVNHLVAKVMAADAHPGVTAFYLPVESAPVRVARIALHRIATFSEAVDQYYGDAYQQKLAHISRRKILKGALGLAMAPVTFSIAKHLFLRSDNPVTPCDWQLLECARDLCYHKSDYHNAQIILHTLLNKFEKSTTTTEGVRMTADALDLLGVMTLRQNQQQRGLTLFSRALKLWKSLNDTEHQIETLFHIGDIYRYAVMTDGARITGQQGLQYYMQARNLTSSALKKQQLFHGRYYGVSSYIYYWTGDYEMAEDYSRECLQYGQGMENTWDYQTASQHLGRILIQRKKFDQALHLLQTTSESSVLQNPYDRVKSLWTLSDLWFAMGKPAEGLEYATRSKQLCQDFGLHLQLLTLQQVLRKHNVPSAVL